MQNTLTCGEKTNCKGGPGCFKDQQACRFPGLLTDVKINIMLWLKSHWGQWIVMGSGMEWQPEGKTMYGVWYMLINTTNWKIQTIYIHWFIKFSMHTICTYFYTYIDMWNVLSFTLAKAGKGRACLPVITYIAFIYFTALLLLTKWSNKVHIIHIGVKGSKTVTWRDCGSCGSHFCSSGTSTDEREERPWTELHRH